MYLVTLKCFSLFFEIEFLDFFAFKKIILLLFFLVMLYFHRK
jgi:hypothetical protein